MVATLLKTGLESLKTRFGAMNEATAPTSSNARPVTAGDIAADQPGECTAAVVEPLLARADASPASAEAIVEQEQLTAQFTGDLGAFDRLEMLVDAIWHSRDPESARTALIAAQVACSTHRFADAREGLARAQALGRCGRRHRSARR